METFKTANMALAAFLVFTKTPLRMERTGGTCFWFFEEDTKLQELVTQFSGGQALVDPRAYSYKLTQMRKEIRVK